MRAVLLLATVIATNVTSAPGEIGAFYFDSLDQSQVWINVEPKSLEPGANPLQLNATISFPGRKLAAAPASVDLRVQASCYAFPTRVRRPEFRLLVDGIAMILDRERPLEFSYSCSDETGMTGHVIIGRLSFGDFRAMAAARDVTIGALSFDVQLTPADIQALGKFASAVSDGVTVK